MATTFANAGSMTEEGERLASEGSLQSDVECADPEAGHRGKSPSESGVVNEELKVPHRRPKRSGCGSPTNHESGCDRVSAATTSLPTAPNGEAFLMLTVIDEHSRECLAIHVQRQVRSYDVLTDCPRVMVRRRMSARTTA